MLLRTSKLQGETQCHTQLGAWVLVGCGPEGRVFLQYAHAAKDGFVPRSTAVYSSIKSTVAVVYSHT